MPQFSLRFTSALTCLVFLHLPFPEACIYTEDCQEIDPNSSCCCTDRDWERGECTTFVDCDIKNDSDESNDWSCQTKECDSPDTCYFNHLCCTRLDESLYLRGTCQDACFEGDDILCTEKSDCENILGSPECCPTIFSPKVCSPACPQESKSRKSKLEGKYQNSTVVTKL